MNKKIAHPKIMMKPLSGNNIYKIKKKKWIIKKEIIGL